MIVRKPKTPKETPKPRARHPKDWPEAIRLHLAKVRSVDAVSQPWRAEPFTCISVVKELREKYYEELLKQENVIEKMYPEISFEFRTWVHQGREPSKSGPPFTELVYQR